MPYRQISLRPPLPLEPERGSLRSYVLVCSSVLVYLACVAYDLEFFYFLVVVGVVLLVVGLVRFDLAMLVVPFVLTNAYPLKETGTNLILSEYVLLILFVAFFLRAVTQFPRASIPRDLLIPALVLIAASVFSLVSAQYVVEGVKQIIRYIEVLLVFFFVVRATYTDERSIRQMVFAVVLSGLAASLVGIGQFLIAFIETGESGRVFGLLGGGYGAVLSSTVLLCVGVLLFDHERKFRALAYATIPCALFGLILNQTRAWIGSLALVLVLMLVMNKRAILKKFLLTFAASLGVLILILGTNVFGLVDQDVVIGAILKTFRFGVRSGEYSTADLSLFLRFNVWSHAISQFLSHPLVGIGVGNLRFVDYFPPRLGVPGENAGFVDNQYLQFFAEGGMIAGLAWIAFVIQSVRLGIRTYRASLGGELAALTFGLSGSILIFTIGSVFWVVTPFHEVFALMILFVALTTNLENLFRGSAG